MFGNAPRALWSRWCRPDRESRIELANRSLLVEDGKRRVLFEAGVGVCFGPGLRARYGVQGEGHQLLDALGAVGLSDADIDVVVLSHLHFDHAGGLLAPDHAEGPRRLLFPNARYLVSRAAYQRARTPHLRDRASFIEALPALLQRSGRLVLIDPDQYPVTGLDGRYRFGQTEGHTPGMLHTEIVGHAQRICFGADLFPGAAWLHLPITMGYDRFPERVVEEKAQVLEQLAANRSWLCFAHDPQFALARIGRDERGRFTVGERRSDDQSDLNLDEAD